MPPMRLIAGISTRNSLPKMPSTALAPRTRRGPDGRRRRSFGCSRVDDIGVPGLDVLVENRDHLGLDGVLCRVHGLPDALLEFGAVERLLQPIRQHLCDERCRET